jgi:hypothetical protein
MTEVLSLLALYPNLAPNPALPAAWWRHLHQHPREALATAFRKAPSQSAPYPPSAELVREIAASWRPPTPKPNYQAAQLPEHWEPLPADNPMAAKVEEIRQAVSRGELRGPEVARAILEAMG